MYKSRKLNELITKKSERLLPMKLLSLIRLYLSPPVVATPAVLSSKVLPVMLV